MKEITTFKVLNDTASEMKIIHEPECFEFMLPANEEVTISMNSGLDTIALRTSVSDSSGKVVLSILDEKSLYSVIYKGENAFEEYLE